MTQAEFEDFLDNWLIRQFTHQSNAWMIREAMLDRYEADPEFWNGQSLWALYDAR